MVIGCQLELLTINGAQPLCYLRVGKEENGVISFCLPFRKKNRMESKSDHRFSSR